MAESFGRFLEWTPDILEPTPSLPGSLRSVARYELGKTWPVCDVDDPAQLLELELRPSSIVSRKHDRTRTWARRLFASVRWPGIRGWSYFDPRWYSYGLWRQEQLPLQDVEPITLAWPTLAEAGRVIGRRIVPRRR